MNRMHPKKHTFRFTLTVSPNQQLSPECDAFLFKQGLEKNQLTGHYVRRSSSLLPMTLALDELEHGGLPWLGTKELPYTLVKERR